MTAVATHAFNQLAHEHGACGAEDGVKTAGRTAGPRVGSQTDLLSVERVHHTLIARGKHARVCPCLLRSRHLDFKTRGSELCRVSSVGSTAD